MHLRSGKFTILMSVYHQDNYKFLNAAFESIENNTLLPDEIVLVEDGPLSKDLTETINHWEKKLNFKIVKLKKNVGLGKALNAGLELCNNELVIRADADDINRTTRFERQVDFMFKNPEVGISSAWIQEFEEMPCDRGFVRKVPAKEGLNHFSKRYCPFNHPAVIFRKSLILRHGGYGNEFLYEDYALWMKLLHSNVIGDNLQEVLVDMRFTDQTYSRRGGFKYFLSEIKNQYLFFKRDYINFSDFFINVASRSFVRLIPNEIRKIIYKYILRKKHD